jgi:flagellar M-ring protein FliF
MATVTQLEKLASGGPGALGPAGGIGEMDFRGRLSALWTFLKIRWAEMPPARRVWAMVAAGLLVAIVGVLTWLALKPDWRTLYSGMESDDAREVGQTLTQAQIPYDVTADGTGIRVLAAQLDKARLATAAKGGAKSGRLGFELFDKPNWVGSEFDEQVNYQRALEGELEQTVETLSDVKSARVHLVTQKDSLFRDQDRPAKASVVLQLRRRTLADGEPDQIRNLVSAAVDGLTPDHVVLVDASGQLLLGPKTAEAMQLSAEERFEENLLTTLEPVTGEGNVRASVSLDYNPAASDETDTTYDPAQSAPTSVQRTEQATGPEAIPAGVPGTASNAPNTQAKPVYPQQSTLPENAKSESSTYVISNKVKHVVENPGHVRRLTAAILVNDRLISPATKTKPAVWQQRSPEELRNITALAQAAVGFDAARGDMLTVQDLSFDGNRAPAPAPMVQQLLATAEGSPMLIKYGALVAGLMLVLAFGVRPALRGTLAMEKATKGKQPDKQTEKELAAAAEAHAALMAPVLTPVEVDAERQRTQEIFEQVAAHLKRQPTQSSRLLQSWIHSD